jgi:sulfur-oxidizing protein SoxX
VPKAHDQLYDTLYSVPEPIENTQAGDSDRGKEIFFNRKKGNCIACHTVSSLGKEPFHGEVGPPLDGMAEKSTDELRLQVINPKIINPDTIMPAFFKHKGLFRVQKKWKFKTILSAQKVEDVVAYMKTLQ